MTDQPEKNSNNNDNNNKLCAVCGDKALGYNFNAQTCESCKAFFRRNALKTKEFKCPFSNECEVTTVTRRFCQKCRLKKCFEIGMKKEWILSDAEKQQKRRKVEENRAKKRRHHESGESSSLSTSLNVSPSQSDEEEEQRDERVKLNDNLLSRKIDKDMSNAAAALMEMQPGSSSSSMAPIAHAPVAPALVVVAQTSSNSSERRPQARVLPSTRSSGISKKVRRSTSSRNSSSLATSSLSTTSTTTTTAQSILSTTVKETANAVAAESLIKQELLISPPSTPFSPQFQPQQLSNLSAFSIQLPHQQQQQMQEQNQNLMPFSSSNTDPNSSRSVSSTSAGQSAGKTSSCGASTSRHVIPDFSESHNLDDIIAVAIDAEFHAKSIEIPVSSRGEELTAQEKSRLEELFVASRSLVEPLDLEKDSGEPNNLISVINLTDLAIKRIIRMAKKISPFISMCQEDQIALLKGGCTELMILRSVINYNPDKNSWRLPSNGQTPRELSMELLKEASELGVNLYEEHQRFVKSFDPRWRTDENVMLLMSAIALFNPKRVNVLHSDVVKLEQDTYFYLLRRYLETVCEGCEPRRAFLQLIGRLKDLQQLNDSHIQVFLEVNPQQVEPLLIEIFDLTPRSANQNQAF